MYSPAEQSARNFAFLRWLTEVEEALQGKHKVQLVWEEEFVPGNSSYPVIYNRAAIRIPQVDPGYTDRLNHNHMDSWSPNSAAKTLYGRAKAAAAIRKADEEWEANQRVKALALPPFLGAKTPTKKRR